MSSNKRKDIKETFGEAVELGPDVEAVDQGPNEAERAFGIFCKAPIKDDPEAVAETEEEFGKKG